MLVLESTKPVVEQARHVTINDAAIKQWAHTVPWASLDPRSHELVAYLSGTQGEIANLILLVDALNFCFWSPDPIQFTWRGKLYRRFEAMFVSLMLAAKFDRQWCNPHYWLRVPRQEIQQVLAGSGQLLLMDEREQIIREVATTLIERFDGEFLNAIDSVGRKAWPLAVLLMTNFDSFRDVSKYQGRPVFFMKRAQICALDISTAWEAQGFPPLSGLPELTAFADYRVPQALRHLGIIDFSPHLAQTVEQEQELPQDSEEEVEIRAVTLHAVERMRGAAEIAGKPAQAWQIDWYLWELGRSEKIVVNHHRTRTVFY